MRYVKLMCKYLKVQYDDMGGRLSHWTSSSKNFGYLEIRDSEDDTKRAVYVACRGKNQNLMLHCPFLEHAPDAVILNNLSQKPSVVSEKLGASSKIVELFNKKALADGKEPLFTPETADVPVIDRSKLPLDLLPFMKAETAEKDKEDAAAKAKAKAKPPAKKKRRVPEGAPQAKAAADTAGSTAGGAQETPEGTD